MYLILDTETGGLDATKDALLSFAFLVVNPELEVIDAMEAFINPTTYTTPRNISMAALNVNKLSIPELMAHGKSVAEVKTLTDTFLSKHFGKEKATLVGWNTTFDRDFMMNNVPIGRFIHRRTLDLTSVCMFLLPTLPSYALQEVITYVRNDIDNTLPVVEAHTAMSDATMTFELFKIFRGLV
jgi:DNA polymerase III alpha subunit (gram-positive type)